MACTFPALEVCGLAQADATDESLTTVLVVLPAPTVAANQPVMSLFPPSAWDTESYQYLKVVPSRSNVIPGVLPSSRMSVMKSWLDESRPILTVLTPLYTAKWDTES